VVHWNQNHLQAWQELLRLVPHVGGRRGHCGDAGWQQHFDLDIMEAVHAVEAAVPFLEASNMAALVMMTKAAAVETVHNAFDAVQTRGDMRPWPNTDTGYRS
jgi:hypothetical protein